MANEGRPETAAGLFSSDFMWLSVNGPSSTDREGGFDPDEAEAYLARRNDAHQTVQLLGLVVTANTDSEVNLGIEVTIQAEDFPQSRPYFASGKGVFDCTQQRLTMVTLGIYGTGPKIGRIANVLGVDPARVRDTLNNVS